MKASQTIAIPRWYGFHRDECQNVQLHVFCDASEIAYGTVAYFRTVTHGCINVSFAISKTRLAPIKALTVPRLELQATVMASRLKSKIFEEIDEMHFWSDSKIVLHYLSNTQRRFSTCVSHRVADIASNSDVKDWHHIPGKMNVADDCTRGIEIQELTPLCCWITGPEFLMLSEAEWPGTNKVQDMYETELEIKGSVLAVATTPFFAMMQWEKYSSWRKLCREYAWWMRYKCILKCKAKKIRPRPGRQTMVLSTADPEEASMALCKQAQVEPFKDDYEDLEANRALSSKSPLLQLQPVLVDEIIRVAGRLTKAMIPYEAKHQALLSLGHPLSRLLVQDIHERHFHVGREHTLALVCQQFWNVCGKSFVRRIINECLLCKKKEG